MKIFIKTRKFISVITALCLLISFVIGPTAANAMTNEEATAKYKQIFKDFMLPYNYGQITSAHYAGTDRVIINIQDLHCHPKVQKNISNIIEIFDKSFGVKNVYLEGVYGQLSTKWISDRIEPAKKSEILEKMLDTGRLTGAEYYSIMSGKTEIISGLEEKYPYLENLKRFGDIIENQDKINLILNAINESLSKVKKQYYTKRQYKLEELSKKYREGTITPQKYYALLLKHTDKLGIDLSKYENTFTYLTLLEMQKTLDYSKITNELQNLILLLRENLANSAYQMLVDNTENFSKIDKLYGYVVRISRELGLDLTINFPNLDNYFGYIEFSQKINPLELIVEEKRLTEEINTRFSETKAQMEVVFLTNFERYMRDYVSSKITADDYEYYKENIDTFSQLWDKYVDNKVLSLLDEYLAEADKFYKINTDRNIYFTDNMFTKESVLEKLENEVEAKGDVNKIIDNMKGVKEVDVVITGGFHSQTVTEILKNHGVSYIVITPNVTDGVKLAEDTYYEIAKEQSKISFQALAVLPFSMYLNTYSKDIVVRATIIAFGREIAKQLFPNEAIDSIDAETLNKDEEAKSMAQQMKKLRRRIEESKFLESDDKNLEDVLKNMTGEDGEEIIDSELLEYVSLEDLKWILIARETDSLRSVLRRAEKDMNTAKNGTSMQKAILGVRKVYEKAKGRTTSKKIYEEKQGLIDEIRNFRVDSKLSEMLEKEEESKFKDFKSRRLESLSRKELKEYLRLLKKSESTQKTVSAEKSEVSEEQVAQTQEQFAQLTTWPTMVILKIRELILKIQGLNDDPIKKQNVVNKLENWQILLGMFFPIMKNIFVGMHGKSKREETKQGLNYIEEIIKASFGTTIEQIRALSRIKRLQAVIILLQNSEAKSIFEMLDMAHTAWNLTESRGAIKNTDKEQAESKSEGFSLGRFLPDFLRLGNKTKAKITFRNDEEKPATILIEKNGELYSITAKLVSLTNKDEEKRDYIDIGIKGKKLVLYLGSKGEHAFSAESSLQKTIESIEKEIPGLEIKVSRHNITIQSNDAGTNISAVKQEETSKIVLELDGKSIEVKEDELNELKTLQSIKDENIETVFLDAGKDANGKDINEKKITELMKNGEEEDTLLIIYPFSKAYDIKSLTTMQKFALYFQFGRNLMDLLDKTWFYSFSGKSSVQYYGSRILLEFIKNAVVHGNLADLSKPIYVRFNKKSMMPGFTVYNAINEKQTMSEEMLSFSAMGEISGMHAGLSHMRKDLVDGIIGGLEQKEIGEEGDVHFYSINVSQNDSTQSLLEERVKEEQRRRKAVRSISFKELFEEHNGTCVLHVEQDDGSIVTVMFSAMTKDDVYVSVISQMLPDGTIIDMTGEKLTIEKINTQFNINIMIDKDKRYVTVQNNENNEAKSISPFVSFNNVKKIVEGIKSLVVPENALNLEELIEKLKRLRELEGKDVFAEEKQRLEQELKQRSLVIYPYYLGYDVTELTSEQLDALYIYISNLLNSITPELLNGDEQLAHCLKETLKNAFLHGNLLNPSAPIYIHFNESMNHFDVYNKVEKKVDSLKSKRTEYFAARTKLLGGTHQFYSEVLQVDYKDILDFDIEENYFDIEENYKGKYYRVSIGRKTTESTPQIEQPLTQQEFVEEEESIVADDRTETIVFNKKTLRDLINSIKEKLRDFFEKQSFKDTSLYASDVINVLEQALSEIEQNPTLVAMKGESANDVKFNVCEFRSLQTFIEDKNNNGEALGEAINKFLLSAILSNDNIFTETDYEAIRNYIHNPDISEDESKKRLEQIKVVARLYGYISFKNKFFEQNEKNETLTNNSVVKIEKEGQVQELALSQWIHICDGHSIALNGNEIGNFASSPEKYFKKDTKRAFESAIIMDEVGRIPAIKANPDIIILQDSKNVYIRKRENSENFDVVVESIFGDLVTMYTVDGAVIKNSNGKYDISQFVENFATQRGNIDIFVGSRDLGYSYPEECCFKKDESGNILQYKNNSWTRCPVDGNGFVMLSRNVIAFDGKPEINKVMDAKVILCKPTKSSPNRYFSNYKDNFDNTNWYKVENSGFVDLENQDKSDLKKEMAQSTFNISGNNYYFLDSINRLYFDSNLNLVDGYDILNYFDEINDYMVFEQITKNKRGENLVKILLFNKSTKEWYYKDLSFVRKIEDGTDTYYILSKPIGLVIKMENLKVKDIQERLNEFKQIESGKETIYTKIAGKWYSFAKEFDSKEPIAPIEDAVDFSFDDVNYLYANKTLYVIADSDTLEQTEQRAVQSFIIDGKKYVNFDNKLYTLEGGNIVPVTEEQADILKADEKNGEWFKLLLDRINPVGLTLSLVLQIFSANEDMKGKNIIVDDDVEINEKLIEAAKTAGINIVKLRIITEQEAQQRGGLLINDQSKIRMSFDSNNNELLVYSKQGINLDRSKIKELITAAYSEGRRDLKFSEEQVIAFAEKGEIGLNLDVDQSLVNIKDRITNAAINGVQMAEVEASLDLSDIDEIGSLENKCKGMSPTTIILKMKHLMDKKGKKLDEERLNEIKKLQEAGFRFVLRGPIKDIENIFQSFSEKDGYHLDGAILEKAEIGDLDKLEELAAENTEGTLHIETQMYINMATATGIDANRIYTDNGIIPIVTAAQVDEMTGKYAIGYGEIKNSDIKKMLSSGKVVNILCSEKDGEKLKDLRDKLAGIFKDMFGTINELLKPKSPEQRISEETTAVSDYDFGEEFGKEIKDSRESLLKDLREGGTVKSILITEFTEENGAKTAVNNFVKDENSIYKQLPSVIQMRIQTAISKDNYFEAIGTIRGTVNQIIDTFVLGQTAFEETDQKELRSKFLKKEYKDYRQYVRIKAIQLVMADAKLKLDELLEARPDTNQTVEQLFDAIRTELNKDVRKTIIANKTAIKEIDTKEIENAKTNLMNVNILLDDSLRDKLVVTKQLDISAQAVRSILSAA